MYRTHFKTEQGFTLVEILVSTAIFVIVVAAMLTMFTYTLQINRRVQALREVVQGGRTFTETLTREIRNGRIDYSSWSAHCPASNYAGGHNQTLAITTRAGDKLCFYLDANGIFQLQKKTATGESTEPLFTSENFSLNADTLRFIVRPITDPIPESSNGQQVTNPGIQPFVTILAEFQLDAGPGSADAGLLYQTTVSTDVYDIPPKSE